MPGKNAIRLEGQIIGVLKKALLFRVELINGHTLLGHVANRRRREAAELKTGDRVNLEISPFDFSRGRIVLEQK